MQTVPDIFVRGSLEMSAFPLPEMAEAVSWIDMGTNRILLMVATLISFISMKSLLQFAPRILFAMDRTSVTVSLEQNYNLARVRTRLALAAVLPLCLIADYCKFYRPSWWAFIPSEWSALATIGVFFCYFIVRRICSALFLSGKISHNKALAIRRSPYSFFLFAVILISFSMILVRIMALSAQTIRIVLLAEISIAYLSSLIRIASVLKQSCKGFSTFLYLCTLELLPTSILVVSALF